MKSSTKALNGFFSFTFHAPVERGHVMQHPRRLVLHNQWHRPNCKRTNTYA